MNTRKEIALRLLRIFITISLGIILFPYLENLITNYLDQIILGFVFSSIVVAILAIAIFFVIKKFMVRNKIRQESYLIDIIHFILRTILLTIFVIYLLTDMKLIWISLILIGIEVFGFLLNDEFKRNKKLNNKKQKL
ncbi:hypothetical protein QVZ41_10240 [Wenyingzhuangia sp. chi5]|uniref:ATP synthase protein I n=1 Tax=Wenyingzhuangia gilva TaxID=3057677 RepID=A0ABT8VTB7_9FLAO|nr:hypothetical protein [Wenyingzhuangia sp. chi5]MDO3695223.1 hypothetical protein [Wenyingzhuangia sp. chi5]